MKKILSFAALCILGLGLANAQLVQVVNEVYYDPNVNGAVLNYPAGHVTYRIYAEMQDPTDFVSSVYAVAGCHTLNVSAGAGNAIWNSPFGGTLGENLNIAFFGFFPELRYDSFGTIGRENSAAPGNAVGSIASCPGPGVWSASLGNAAGPALSVCDGALYALNGDPNGLGVGPLNRVLLFQITMPAANSLTYNLNLQVFDEGVGANEIRYVWDADNVGCGSPTEVSGECLGLLFPEPPACSGAPGCTDINACNYDPAATQDDGSCEYLSCAGCTDVNACNYDPAATIDDGSCEFLSCAGCTDVNACNYDAGATIDDGSCTFPGCDDANACNYDPAAGCNDGSCEYISCAGCTDPGACNFDAGATIDDGSCILPNVTFTLEDDWGDGWNGATYTITDDDLNPIGSGTLASGAGPQVDSYCLADGCYILNVTAGGFPEEIIWELAGVNGGPINFGPNNGNATVNLYFSVGAGVCAIPGCTDPAAINYDPAATSDDGSCLLADCAPDAPAQFSYCYGNNENTFFTFQSTNPGVTNVLLGFIQGNTESCCDEITVYDGPDGASPMLFTGTDVAGVVLESSGDFITIGISSDVSISCQSSLAIVDLIVDVYCGVLAQPGCTDPGACNYDPFATQDDGSCQYPGPEDLCAGATPAMIGVPVTVDNSCALPDGPAQACAFGGDPVQNDVWVSFVAPAFGGTLVIETSEDGVADLTDTGIQILDGCGGNVIGCDDDSGVGLFSRVEVSTCDLTPGNTYYVQIDGYNGDAGTCNVTISAANLLGCTDPLALNYDPCATIDDGSCILGGLPTLAIAPEFFPNCNPIAGSTVIPGANSGLPSYGPFGGNTDDEVFYEFIAPCNGAIKARVQGAPGFDAVVELHDGSFNPLDAADATLGGGLEIVYSDGIVAGNTYYVRIYDWYTGVAGSFNICLTAYCASSPDDPYPTLTYDACGTYKCDYIAGAAGYDWSLVPQGGGATLTYSSVGNNTFLNLDNLSGNPVYGETYDVTIDTRFNDPDLGLLVVQGQVSDVLVMQDEPLTELRSDFVGGIYQLNANIRCVQSCGADFYIWRLTPVGGESLPDVQVSGASTIVNLCDFSGILPATSYTVEIAVVYSGIQYSFGPAQPISTAAQPLVFLRAADNCNNAGPLQLGAYIRTNAFVPCAKDWTWEFTRTDVPELPIYWKKGDGVRLLQLSAVKDLQTNTPLLVAGATYNVRVKPEYGNFLGNGNNIPGAEPDYDFATSYGAVDQICIVGGAVNGGGNNFVAEDVQPVREAGATLEAALYPNPTNGSFVNLNVSNIGSEVEKVLVDIYDSFGKLVWSRQFAANDSGSLNTVVALGDQFASGVYMVNITVGSYVQTERLVIQK